MLKLHVVPADGQPFEVPIESDSIVIGRSSASDLVIRDRFLSRKHARLYAEGGSLFVEDLGARNGTFVNRTLIKAPIAVRAGDEIKLAGSVIRIYDPEAPAAAPGPAALPTDPPHASHEVSLENASIVRPAAEMLELGEVSGGGTVLRPGIDVRRYAERLQLMLDVHNALGRIVDLSPLLDLILDRVFDHLKPEQAAIYLRGDDGEYHRAAGRTAPGTEADLVPARSLVHEVADKRLAAIVMDVEQDERFKEAQSIVMSGIRSLLAAPLLEEDGSLGLIVVSSKAASKQFSEPDLELLVSLASVAALRIRNAELAEEAAERKRLEEELALARRIQTALLPQELPRIEGYELFGNNFPSRGVSGDYYSITDRAEGRECVLVVADVSGKGMAASLLTASLEALAAGPIEVGNDPAVICDKVSRRLYKRTPPEKYATAFVAILDTETHAVRYANAGHNPGLVVRADGSAEELGSTGMPVGLMDDAEFEASTVELQPGDLLVLYTDGIVEAFDPDGEQYEIDRLRGLLVRERTAGLDALADALDVDLAAFVRGVPYGDDRTLVIVRRSAV